MNRPTADADLALRAAQRSLREAIERGTPPPPDPTGNEFLDALLRCAEHLHTPVAAHRVAAARRQWPSDVPSAARSLGMRVRQVDLAPATPWWRGDVDALVVQLDGRWLAVTAPAGRRMLQAPDGERISLDADVAARVERTAYSVTPVLPGEPAGWADLTRIGWSAASRRDVWAIAVGTVAAAFLATLTPILSGQIVSQFIPTGETGRIVSVAIILAVVALISGMVSVLQSLFAQRLAARSDLRISAALYDRLIRLPMSFHRGHDPGELAQRVAGFSGVRDVVAVTVPTLLSAISGLVASVAVLLWRMPSVALLVIVVSAVFLVAGAAIVATAYRAARDYTAESLQLSGTLLALLGGIAKIRVAGAENRMYARWLSGYARQQRAARVAGTASIRLSLVIAIPTAVVSLLVVAVAAASSPPPDLGTFTTVSAAAAQAAGAITVLLPLAAGLVAAIPAATAIVPLLEAVPDAASAGGEDPGVLHGDVELANVSFSYEAGALVLDDIELVIPAGTMTAIVGPSGSGKSTLVRMLLGLEEPTAGQVLYDGRSLAQLDTIAVRRQIGVVPQDAALATGSLLDNIAAGATGLSEADAWRAADEAGVGDDIRAMPMGLQTVVSDGAGTFSGGQRQRVLLARALARRPRIVVLDEATSALDNTAQATVASSLAALGATRIVVAHRLSTIRDADQIVVVDAGRIVQRGSFDDLAADTAGLFASLAARQQAAP